MRHIVSYSGGLNSFATAEIVCGRFGKENTLLVFTDTKSEDEDLYRFLDETVKFLGCEFLKLEDGKHFYVVYEILSEKQ